MLKTYVDPNVFAALMRSCPDNGLEEAVVMAFKEALVADELWYSGARVERRSDGAQGEVVATDDLECGGFPLPIEEVRVEWDATGDQTWEKISNLKPL